MSSLALLVVIAFALAAVPWMLVAGRRFGHLLAGAAVLVIELVAVVFAAVASAWIRFDAVGSALIALAVIFGTGLVAVGRRRPGLPGRSALATWVPAGLGGLVWAGIVAVSPQIAGASPLAWVMRGDGFNNLYYARVVLADGGVALGGGENPTPLPALAIALSGMPQGAGSTGGSVLEAELTALAIAWVLALGFWCLMSGVAAASLVPRSRPAVAAVAAALGSLLPLTAFAGGLPTEWGYFNVNLAIALVLAGWLVQLASRRHPVASLVASAAILTLLLATWTPLALLFAPAPAVVVWRERARLRTLSGIRVFALLAALVPLVLWVALTTIPSFLQQSGALSTSGHGFPTTWVATLVVGLGLGVLVVVLRRRLDPATVQACLALTIGAALTFAAVVALARGAADGYYPTKLAWMLAVILGTVVLAVVIGRLALIRAAAVPVAAAVCVAVLAIATFAVPTKNADWVSNQPVAMVLGGKVWHDGDVTVQRILALSDSGRPGLLWRSGSPDEGIVDFWVLVTNGGELGGDGFLRGVAFQAYRAQRDEGTWEGTDDAQLCEIIERVPELTVYSRDLELSATIAELCGIADRASLVLPFSSLESGFVAGNR